MANTRLRLHQNAAEDTSIGPLREGESTVNASLRQLEGISLVIEVVGSVGQKLLSKDQIRTDIELRLRRNGIRLLSPKEWLDTPGNPFLSLSVSVAQTNAGTYVWSYVLWFQQRVLLERDPEFSMIAPTWCIRNTGFAGLRAGATQIRGVLGEAVDEFCAAFLAAK